MRGPTIAYTTVGLRVGSEKLMRIHSGTGNSLLNFGGKEPQVTVNEASAFADAGNMDCIISCCNAWATSSFNEAGSKSGTDAVLHREFIVVMILPMG
jgi:hypothetical protein